MKIAGCTAAVSSLFESTPQYFFRYLTQEPANFSICVIPEDIAYERQDTVEEALEEGFRIRNFPDTYLERAVIQRKFADFLLTQDVLLLHGSVVAVDGYAYLFTAKSGTGKSTHTRLWRQHFGDRAVMVNDDKPFLQIRPDRVMACGSPWSGKHGLDTNVCLPLKGICLLERGPENHIQKATPEQLLPLLYKQCHRTKKAEHLARQKNLVDALAGLVPLWQMRCNKNEDAATAAFAAMSSCL